MLEQEDLATMELIHEAALDPAGWTPLLNHLATRTGCVAGGITIENPSSLQGQPLTYFGFDAGHVQRTFNHYLPMNPLFGIAPRMRPGFVVTNGDVVPLAAFRRTEFYQGWARPQGLCSPVTVVIRRTPESYVPLTLVRADGEGEVSAASRRLLTRLAPHLVRAMNVTVRLQAANAPNRTLMTALGSLAGGAILLDRRRRIVFANPLATRLLEAGTDAVLASRAGALAAVCAEADAAVQAAIGGALGGRSGDEDGPGLGGKVVIERARGAGPVTLTVVPLPRPDRETGRGWSALADDLPGQAGCLVLIDCTDTAAVARAYGLTRAEARLLAALAAGKGLAAAAQVLGITRSTAHSQLDKVFHKTGTHRQAELVALTRNGAGP